jgi:hypothetical protein
LKNIVTVIAILAVAAPACAYGVGSVDDPALEPQRDGGPADITPAGGPRLDASPGATESLLDASARDDATDRGVPDAVDSGSPGDAATVIDASSALDAGSVIDATPTGTDGSTCIAHGFSGALLTFDLAGQPGNEPSVPATSAAAGVSAGSLSRSTALIAAAGSASINASNWPATGRADPGQYYAFTVTPSAGCALTLASLSIDVRASTTGPSAGDVATSVDGFAHHFGPFGGTTTANVAIPVVGGSGPIEVRIYGFGSSSTAGTMRLQNTLRVSGALD